MECHKAEKAACNFPSALLYSDTKKGFLSFGTVMPAKSFMDTGAPCASERVNASCRARQDFFCTREAER